MYERKEIEKIIEDFKQNNYLYADITLCNDEKINNGINTIKNISLSKENKLILETGYSKEFIPLKEIKFIKLKKSIM